MPALFGPKLRLLRQQHGLTQGQVATAVELAAHAHIGKLEIQQDVPSLRLVLRIARVFGVSIEYLLRDTLPVTEHPPVDPTQLREREAPYQLHMEPAQLPWPPALFGLKLRTLRLQRQLTQETLAQQLGLQRQNYLSRLERGRGAPSLELALRIADHFGVTTDYLLQDAIPLADGDR